LASGRGKGESGAAPQVGEGKRTEVKHVCDLIPRVRVDVIAQRAVLNVHCGGDSSWVSCEWTRVAIKSQPLTSTAATSPQHTHTRARTHTHTHTLQRRSG
jgi:hypothetical protein